MDLKQLLNIIPDAGWYKYSRRLQVIEATGSYVHWETTLNNNHRKIGASSVTDSFIIQVDTDALKMT